MMLVVRVVLVWLCCNAAVFIWALGFTKGNVMAQEKQHLIVAGNPTDGFEYIGPFRSFVDAVHYADTELAKRNDPWWVAALDGPSNIHTLRESIRQ